MKEIITLSRTTPFKAYKLTAKFGAYLADILIPTGETYLGERIIIAVWRGSIKSFGVPGHARVSEAEFDFNILKSHMFNSVFIELPKGGGIEKEITDIAKALVKGNLL